MRPSGVWDMLKPGHSVPENAFDLMAPAFPLASALPLTQTPQEAGVTILMGPRPIPHAPCIIG